MGVRTALAVALGLAIGVSPAVFASGQTTGCLEQAAVVVVDLDDARYPHIADHIHDAIRRGRPEFMTIARDQATANRRAALAASGLPSLPDEDRDEYPMAFSDEGGAGSDVRYVDDAENQGAGSVVGRVLRPYCDGQRFTVR